MSVTYCVLVRPARDTKRAEALVISTLVPDREAAEGPQQHAVDYEEHVGAITPSRIPVRPACGFRVRGVAVELGHGGNTSR